MLMVRNRLNKLQSYSLPSSRYTDLTLGPSATSYTAPADGYFYISKHSNQEHQYLLLSPTGNSSSSFSNLVRNSDSIGSLSCSLPCLKGDVIKCSYTMGGATNCFRFYYALGSAPQT